MNDYCSLIELIKCETTPYKTKHITQFDTLLLGNTLHKGKDSWFHEIFKPLSADEVHQLEIGLQMVFHEDLRAFYFATNGIRLYSDEVAIFGLRNNFIRSNDSIWQPYCLITANTNDRPKYFSDDYIVIGSYSFDGSLVCYDNNSGVVKLFEADTYKKIIANWPTLYSFLSNEYHRLKSFFDDELKLIDEDASTLPTGFK